MFKRWRLPFVLWNLGCFTKLCVIVEFLSVVVHIRRDFSRYALLIDGQIKRKVNLIYGFGE